MSTQLPSSPKRRSFLTRLNAGLASFAAMSGVLLAAKKAPKPAAASRFEPARHEKDDWLDQLSGKHRLVFDTTNPNGLGEAIFFANNFVNVNQSDYGLQPSDLAIVIIVRHGSTPFGYNDAMWAKYGPTFAALSKAADPKTKMAPNVNLYNAAGYGQSIPNFGVTLDAIGKLGVQIAVCSIATRAYAGAVAGAVGGEATAIFNELTSNLVRNARMVPAGIVCVNRAQERGYSLVTT